MIRRLTSAVLLLALGFVSARSADSPTVSFDEVRRHVYWCGQPLRSPLVFTLSGGQMRLNGLGPRVLASDTLRREQEAERIFGRVPEVQRMHVHGYPYRAAGDLLGWVLARMATRVRAAYTRAAPSGEAQAHQAAMLVVDTSLVDVSQPVAIDSLTMRFTPKGLSRPVTFTGKPGAIVGLKEMGGPGTEAEVAARADSVRQALRAPDPLVLLVDETGQTSIRGPKAVEAERTIESLIAKTRAGEPVEYGAEHMQLGRRAFDLIVDAARKP